MHSYKGKVFKAIEKVLKHTLTEIGLSCNQYHISFRLFAHCFLSLYSYDVAPVCRCGVVLDLFIYLLFHHLSS